MVVNYESIGTEGWNVDFREFFKIINAKYLTMKRVAIELVSFFWTGNSQSLIFSHEKQKTNLQLFIQGENSP